ncbi:MAG: hypothetical protein DWQ07_17685 [Chloroflexi bacterium]|nr:MAG: hypothetical protein DWQ07_17685 [Chloroflexota bacterium]
MESEINSGNLLALTQKELELLLKQMGADILQMMINEDSREAIVDLVPRHARTLVSSALDKNGKGFPVNLIDQAKSPNDQAAFTGRVVLGPSGDIALFVDGFGTQTTEPGHGAIAFIEKWMDELRLIVFSDINREEPTVVSLAKAAESCRTPVAALKD